VNGCGAHAGSDGAAILLAVLAAGLILGCAVNASAISLWLAAIGPSIVTVFRVNIVLATAALFHRVAAAGERRRARVDQRQRRAELLSPLLARRLLIAVRERYRQVNDLRGAERLNGWHAD
jgi:hypothetical protein